jgi:BolA protein
MVPNRRFGCEEGGAGPDTFKTMEMKLKEAFQPVSCQVLNPNGDYNSAVIKIVSSSFEGKLPVARHRMVNEVLKNEIKMIHAVQIDAKTPNK